MSALVCILGGLCVSFSLDTFHSVPAVRAHCARS